MKYSKPEIEVLSLDTVDVIATSATVQAPTQGDNDLPIMPISGTGNDLETDLYS